MARTVMDPDLHEWRVGREWLPFRVRVPRGRDSADLLDFPDLGFFDDAGGILAALTALASVVVLFLVIWPVIAIAAELVLVVLLVLAGVAGRVVLRRPWTVRAVSRSGGGRRWQVVGWRASGALIDEVAASLQEGRGLPPAGLDVVYRSAP
jgi:hypothetical protein